MQSSRPPGPRRDRPARRPSHGCGTLTADAGEYRPADPAKFTRSPAIHPTQAGAIRASYSVTSTCTRAGRRMPAGRARRSTREPPLRARREVISTSGQPAKLAPAPRLVAITDHSDGMGVIAEIKGGNAEMMADATLKRWHEISRPGRRVHEGRDGADHASRTRSCRRWSWIRGSRRASGSRTRIAEKYNEPAASLLHRLRVTSNAGGVTTCTAT